MATTPADAYRPMQAGRGEQDAAAVMAVIVASAGARCKANVGKPSALTLETARAVLGVDNGSPELHVTDPLIAAAAEAVRGANVAVSLGGGTISDVADPAEARP